MVRTKDKTWLQNDLFTLFVIPLNVHCVIIVGKKKFLFGDKACEFDCTIFGMIAQLLWQMPGSPLKAYIEGNCALFSL